MFRLKENVEYKDDGRYGILSILLLPQISTLSLMRFSSIQCHIGGPILHLLFS